MHFMISDRDASGPASGEPGVQDRIGTPTMEEERAAPLRGFTLTHD